MGGTKRTALKSLPGAAGQVQLQGYGFVLDQPAGPADLIEHGLQC
jgi:hypothetical protein